MQFSMNEWKKYYSNEYMSHKYNLSTLIFDFFNSHHLSIHKCLVFIFHIIDNIIHNPQKTNRI